MDGFWEITELASNYGDAQSTLMNQVWWGDISIAGAFAQALGPIAITTDSYNKSQNLGAYYAFAEVSDPPRTNLLFRAWRTNTSTLGNFTGINFARTTRTDIKIYATAARVPELTILALIGLGLFGLGFSRPKRDSSSLHDYQRLLRESFLFVDNIRFWHGRDYSLDCVISGRNRRNSLHV